MRRTFADLILAAIVMVVATLATMLAADLLGGSIEVAIPNWLVFVAALLLAMKMFHSVRLKQPAKARAAHAAASPHAGRKTGATAAAAGAVAGAAVASHSDSGDGTSDDWMSGASHWEPTMVNPATGLPMIGGMGGIDAGGNVFGTDNSHDWSSMGSSSSGSMFD